jgi:hypothetical protein
VVADASSPDFRRTSHTLMTTTTWTKTPCGLSAIVWIVVALWLLAHAAVTLYCR